MNEKTNFAAESAAPVEPLQVPPQKFRRVSRMALFTRAIILLLLGFLILFRPLPSITIGVIVLGFYVAFEGVTLLANALQLPPRSRSLVIINALVLLLLGIMAIIFPWMMGEYAVIFLGAWQIVNGVQCLLLLAGHRHKIKILCTGLVTVAVGIFFMLVPFWGLLTLSWLLAIFCWVTGILMLLSGVSLIDD